MLLEHYDSSQCSRVGFSILEKAMPPSPGHDVDEESSEGQFSTSVSDSSYLEQTSNPKILALTKELNKEMKVKEGKTIFVEWLLISDKVYCFRLGKVPGNVP